MNKKLRITLYVAAIFLAGVVTGLFGAFQLARQFMPSPDRIARHWCAELDTRLQLTPAQLDKIRPAIQSAVAGFGTIVADDMMRSLSNCNARIVLELTPDQRIRFAQIEAEQQEFIRTKFGDTQKNP